MATENVKSQEEEKREGTNNEQPKKEKKKIVEYEYGINSESKLTFEHEEFKAFGRFTRITNKDLSLLIKSYLTTILHDLRGVMIMFDGVNLDTRLYFQKNTAELPNNKIPRIVDLTKPSNDKSIFARQKAIYNAKNQNIYTLNDATRVLLSDFMYGGRDANKPKSNRWNDNINQMDMMNGLQQTNPNYLQFYAQNVHDIYVEVKGIDLNRLIKVIYGNEMVIGSTIKHSKDSGDKVINHMSSNAMYMTRFAKPSNREPGVFYIQIEQFDADSIEAISDSEDIRIFSAPNGIQFY